MKYWTLFTLRILARLGLSLGVLLWVASQWVPLTSSSLLGRQVIRGTTNELSVSVEWFHNVNPVLIKMGWKIEDPMEHHLPVVQLPGLDLWVRSQMLAVRADHWLICTVLLVTTTATSWRWQPKASKQTRGDA